MRASSGPGVSINSFCSLISSVFKGLANIFGPRSHPEMLQKDLVACLSSLLAPERTLCPVLWLQGTPGSKGVAAALCSLPCRLWGSEWSHRSQLQPWRDTGR